MFLRFLFIAICLDLANANSCPTTEEMRSCQCRKFSGRLEVRCENSQTDQMMEALSNLASTGEQPIELKLKGVELFNLPSNLLEGFNLVYFTVEDCGLSSVDGDAFSDVADTLLWLFLRRGSLKSVPSEALEKLYSLTDLDLAYNELESLQGEAFKGLQSLTNLWLTGNRIKSIDDSAFVGIGNEFAFLFIGENELTAVPSQQLRHLTSIKHLIMNKNKITSLEPEEFEPMGGQLLIELNLANNNIRQLPSRAFSSLKRLQNLYLSKNLIESVHHYAFQGLEESLLYLHLDNNRLNEIPAVSLQKLYGLRTIHFEGNNISTVRKNDFLPYGENLKYIFLEKNSLSSVDPTTFACLNSLKYLFLQSNQLNTMPYETYLPVLDTLNTFNISDNPLHCDCEIAWLKNWMNGKGLKVMSLPSGVKCASPEDLVNMPMANIPEERLVCRNETRSSELLQGCESTDAPGTASNLQLSFVVIFMVTLQVSLTCFGISFG